MANPAVPDGIDTVSRATTVVKSATVLINGINARLEQAKADALANGATAEELAPFQVLIDEFDTHVGVLAEAVAANTVAEDEPEA